MPELKSAYAIAAAEQMSLVGVFLGGVSVTILVTIVVFSSSSKSVNWIVGSSALAACSLLISVIASLRLVVALHPDLPEVFVASSSQIWVLWNTMITGYGIGVMSLITSIGLSGWLKSPKTGWLTSAIAGMTMAFFVFTSIFS